MCIVPQLSRSDYYLMMCDEVLQYNHYTTQVHCYQKEQRELHYPFLKCSVDELFDMSLSESDLALFLSVMNEQKEMERYCLSENSLFLTASTLLDIYSQTTHSFIPTLLLHTLFQIPCIASFPL